MKKIYLLFSLIFIFAYSFSAERITNTITQDFYDTKDNPLDPYSFSAATHLTTQINLSFATNGAGDNVVIVYDMDGSFDIPSGAPPAAGNAFAGGIVVYNGTSSLTRPKISLQI